MIDHISIRDFAIIDNIAVDFGPGLSVITGETGSGKSILVTAISLALGSRADSSFVRSGKEKAIIELAGTVNGQDFIISREINATGKNLCKLNGNIVTLSELQAKCFEIADIHGQYDNQYLLNPDNHIHLVDSFYGSKIFPVLDGYKEAYSKYTAKKRELNDLISLEADNARRLDFYKFELNEIDSACLVPNEDEEAKDRLSLLQNSEKIFGSVQSAYNSIDGSSGAYTHLGNAVGDLEKISSYSGKVSQILDSLTDVYYRLEDLSSELRSVLEEMTFNPDEIDRLIERLNLIDGLKKKYSGPNNSISDILQYRDRIEKELAVIENFDDEKKRLSDECEEAYRLLLSQGEQLSKLRRKSADILSGDITSELKDLNFSDASLIIEFTESDEPMESGMETAEILIRTNLGEAHKALAKTASGGEISRIMLAIKKITAAYDNVPTLIFDEIDQGISGRTAAIVGKKLKEISGEHQIICITHLPQIAAQGDSNYRIYKESDKSSTYTRIDKLNDDENIMEIARLLGGEEITEKAIENAKELIASF